MQWDDLFHGIYVLCYINDEEKLHEFAGFDRAQEALQWIEQSMYAKRFQDAIAAAIALAADPHAITCTTIADSAMNTYYMNPEGQR